MFANGLCRVNDCGSERKFKLAANGRRFCAARKSALGPSAIPGDVRYCGALKRPWATPLARTDEVIEQSGGSSLRRRDNVSIVKVRAI
jgi:hypothetical protein